MTRRTPRLLTAALAGAALAGTAAGREPVKLPAIDKKVMTDAVDAKPVEVKKTVADEAAVNQKLAEAVASRLASSSVADGADVSVVTQGGTCTVTGVCRTADQKRDILQDIRIVPGVKLVRDGLAVGNGVMQAQAGGPVTGMPPAGVMPAMPSGGYAGPLQDPVPLGIPGGGGGSEGAAPPLPPYAWPTYAPHNNVSRVGYPTAYPYNAFPFIGPFYPFPKVPLGWRSVTMTWEDGHWFYGRTAAPHDYWRVRFW